MTSLLIICSWQALQRPHAADIGKPGGRTDQVFVKVQPLVSLKSFTWWMWIMDAEVDANLSWAGTAAILLKFGF